MKKSTEEWLIAFSFVLPGASQYVNNDHKKGIALFSVAVAGLVMFLLGAGNVAWLGGMMLFGTFMINTLDVMFQPIFTSLKEINESLQGILVSLESISSKMEFIALELRRQNMILMEINRKLGLIGPLEQKFSRPRGSS